MKKNIYFLIGLLSLILSSCLSEEGEGGTSVVQGYVYKVLHEDDTYNFETDTFPAAKTDVYIVYGNQPIYGDKMETGYDGFYRFQYLNKGFYKIYSYTTLPNGVKTAVMDSVTVGNGGTKTLNNIYIHEGKTNETSYIKGTVLVKYYDKGYVSGLIPACDVRVYIRRKDAAYHFDEVRTGSDGVFMFQRLNPGQYEVFVLTEQAGEKILSPIIKTIEITTKGEIVTIPAPFEIIINA
ncbi:MAG TPA: hypothetical protein VK152_08135 [Paludibacter sp.]|nr:hypothetical protein [Paludibacter sp.]